MVVHILVSDLKLKKRPRLVREGKGGKKGLGINILFFFLYQKPHTLGSGKPCLKKIRLLQGKQHSALEMDSPGPFEGPFAFIFLLQRQTEKDK